MYAYMRAKYTNIAIPTELASEIDKVVSSKRLGYTSRAQFAIEAIRERILKLKN